VDMQRYTPCTSNPQLGFGAGRRYTHENASLIDHATQNVV